MPRCAHPKHFVSVMAVSVFDETALIKIGWLPWPPCYHSNPVPAVFPSLNSEPVHSRSPHWQQRNEDTQKLHFKATWLPPLHSFFSFISLFPSSLIRLAQNWGANLIRRAPAASHQICGFIVPSLSKRPTHLSGCSCTDAKIGYSFISKNTKQIYYIYLICLATLPVCHHFLKYNKSPKALSTASQGILRQVLICDHESWQL